MSGKNLIPYIIASLNLKFETEYRFDSKRKWRADWYIPSLNVIIEYEGLMSEKARHTTKIGYTKDTEKYNAAAIAGYTVLRYTAINAKTLLYDLEKIIQQKTPKLF